jgi:hypothetical protein
MPLIFVRCRERLRGCYRRGGHPATTLVGRGPTPRIGDFAAGLIARAIGVPLLLNP